MERLAKYDIGDLVQYQERTYTVIDRDECLKHKIQIDENPDTGMAVAFWVFNGDIDGRIAKAA